MITRLVLFLFLAPLASGGVYRFATYEPSRSARSVSDWHCGIGSISGGISNALSYFSEEKNIFPGINVCCMEHDDLIDLADTQGINRLEIDRVFCDCLENIGTSYIHYVIKPLFCTAIRTYTMLFHNDS
ncbi:hypothetical protein PMAYCL1PPCAC_31044 [Pristionchus mayeri]|uniref:Uncharacterized protein n=1 Tax=Pristionchus mayeri TaxID=1317129 RepID=A0AAN5DFH6_9BILA|nr:hypothetical protein PMAYCL1PPCAC_31044 [Pristionchus mayeri]